MLATQDQLRTETPIVKISMPDENAVERFMNGDEYTVEGVDLLGREDVAIPRVTLVQAQTDIPNAARHAGEWHNSLTGEFKTSLNAVLLSLGLGRVAFPRKYDKASEPLCGSDDAIQPRAEYIGNVVTDTTLNLTSMIPEDCASCPFSQFGPNGDTPLCAKTYIYFMYDIETGLPFIVQMQRTATKAAKNINTIARMQGRKRLISLTSKEVPSNSGTYYEPVFASGELTPADILAQSYQLTLEFGNMARRLQREQRIMNEVAGDTQGNIEDHDPEKDLPF